MKIKASVLFGEGQDCRVEEVELLPPERGEVLVRVAAAGICHSDLHVIDGVIKKPFPIILGHEGAGVVEEVGEGVSLVRPGDRVILSWTPDCGRCPFCTTGRPNLCDNRAPYAAGTMADGTVRVLLNGEPVYNYAGVSSYGEYTVVPETGAIPITADVPLSIAALVGCAVTTGVCAVTNTAAAEPGSAVAIFGCGGVGLNAIQGAALVNALPIIAVDVVPGKLEMALRFGATHTVNAREQDPVQAIMELTGGRGADYAIEAIGNPAVMAQAFRSLRKRGTAVAIGIGRPDAEISIPAQLLVYGERRLVGSFYGSARPRVDFDRMLRLYQAGKLKLDELITRRIGLDGVNEAFAAMRAGDVARSVIVFDETGA
jgi:S-(hydroxymethyl)glutathione dehydrogenase / alcohol dehydrogenase